MTSYDELTATMSERNRVAFTLAPGYIGGDSTDIEAFVEEVYQKPVTDENMREVAQLFRRWYKEQAPDEYHDPPSEFARPGAPLGNTNAVKPAHQHLVRLSVTVEPDQLAWLKQQAKAQQLTLSELVRNIIAIGAS